MHVIRNSYFHNVSFRFFSYTRGDFFLGNNDFCNVPTYLFRRLDGRTYNVPLLLGVVQNAISE